MTQENKTKILIDAVTIILYEHDPVGINGGCNPLEYDLEAKTIVPRLNNTCSVKEVRNIVHEEFCHWFGELVTGNIDKYDKVSANIHKILGTIDK